MACVAFAHIPGHYSRPVQAWQYPEAAPLKELFRSNDAVLLSFVEAILSDAGVAHQIADGYMSIMEGSLGVLPRRVLVAEDEWAQARRILKAADLDHVVGQE
jgi:hypothetical protein